VPGVAAGLYCEVQVLFFFRAHPDRAKGEFGAGEKARPLQVAHNGRSSSTTFDKKLVYRSAIEHVFKEGGYVMAELFRP